MQEIWNIQNKYLISGYASVFNVLDLRRDTLSPDSFLDYIRKMKDAIDVKILWQHDYANPIGKVVSIKSDNYGLYIVAEICESTIKSIEAINLIKSKIIDSFSIGFTIKKYQNINCGRRITKAELMEISIVTFPCNLKSKIDSIIKINNEYSIEKVNSLYFNKKISEKLIVAENLINKITKQNYECRNE